MEAQNKPNRLKLVSFPQYIIAVGAALLLFATSAVYADGPLTMAPPIQPAQDQSYGPSSDVANVSADTVFNWNEVPENQQVPIDRAVFDQGGYQLYDSVGETIVVPFTDNNLYVMKFAVSPDDTMFFVNDGTAPTLYVPQNGYLENGTVAGAKWYPFSEQFHPSEPVFIGCAPSWTAFISMGWYPGMVCHGGFWCGVSFWDGGLFVPTVGLDFVIGGHPCFGWDAFDTFCGGHPGFVRVGFFHPFVYRFADQPHFGGHPFAGGHPWNGDRGFTDRTEHVGASHPGFNSSNTGHNSGFSGQGGRTWNSGGSTNHVFQGAGGGSGWNGSRGNDNRTSDDHSFGGTQHTPIQSSSSGGRVFRGGDASNGGSSSWSGRPAEGGQYFGGGNGRVFRGGDASTGGSTSGGNRSFGGGGSTFGGDRSFGGGRPSGGQSDAAPAHSFGGGSSGWSGRSSGGGSTFSGGGDRSVGGGDRSSGGGDRSSGGRDNGGNNSGGGRNGNGGGWGR